MKLPFVQIPKGRHCDRIAACLQPLARILNQSLSKVSRCLASRKMIEGMQNHAFGVELSGQPFYILNKLGEYLSPSLQITSFNV